MEQNNSTTEQEKNTPTFTTNWYLYKMYLRTSPTKTTQLPHKLATIFKPQSETNRSTNKKPVKFEKILLEAIDEGLSLIGESAKQVIYIYLEKTFKMDAQDIPSRIEEFSKALENIFGTGSKIIEIQIMKKLFNKVGYSIKNYPSIHDLTFTEYVPAIKQEKEKRENINSQQPN